MKGSHQRANAPTPHAPTASQRWTRALWCVTALLALVIVGLLIRSRTPAGSSQTPPTPPATPAPSAARDHGAYAGSTTCQECHPEAFDAWKQSHHGLAERTPTPTQDAPAFDPTRTFHHGTQQTTVSRSNDVFMVTTGTRASPGQAYAVQRVIGVDPLQQYLVSFPGGRLQTLEASYDIHQRDWFNVYGSEDRQPGEWGHWTGRGMNWNSMCASCHNTRVHKNYDPATDSYRTVMAEPTVSCEACHGPAQAHVAWQREHHGSDKPDPTLRRLTSDQMLDTCGSCHARRSELTGDFKPGDRFGDCLRLSQVDDSDTYHPDGQVHGENFELSAFLGSRMHFQGVRCGDCHEPHSAKTRLPGNWLCLRCHNGGDSRAPVINPVSHSFHPVFGFDAQGVATNLDLTTYPPKDRAYAGGECIHCHMPQTVYMQRHRRHDHGFTVPDPLLTRELGIPNACNRCHTDQSVDWAIEWTERWYGPKLERYSRQRTRSIARARHGESGAHVGLLNIITREEIPYWRAVAIGLLRPWGAEPTVTPVLMRHLADTNALVRAAAVRALEPTVAGNPQQVAALQPLLNDPVRDVRIAAAWALRESLDRTSTAARDLQRSLEINADQPAGQVALGTDALARGEPDTALAHYQKALEWDPGSAAIHQELAVVLSSLGRTRDAIPHLQSACTLDPTNAEPRFLLALGWNELGQPQKTVEALQEAVRLDPRHARAWYNLGLALNTVGQPDEGLAALLRAESLEPTDPGIPYARATILAGLGRTAEARQAAARALEIQPGYPPARQLLQRTP